MPGQLQALQTLVVPVQVYRGYTAATAPCHILFQAPWSYQPNDNLNEFVAHTAVAEDDIPGGCTCTPQGIPLSYGGLGGGGAGVIAGAARSRFQFSLTSPTPKVRLQISQSAVLTRNAFDGVLDITNNSGTPLNNVHVNLTFTDTQGNDASAAFFSPSPQLAASAAAGISALPAAPGPNLAGSEGVASYLFIPTDSAVPTAPTVYDIGGSFSYDDAQGNRVTMPIFPATISVYPDAHFVLNYFWQKDVAGDNPFTPDVTEPSEPAYIGLIATNVGPGDAEDLTITSSQPQIIDNQKVLLCGLHAHRNAGGREPRLAHAHSRSRQYRRRSKPDRGMDVAFESAGHFQRLLRQLPARRFARRARHPR